MGLWVLTGILVACCWVAIAFLSELTYNPGRSAIAAITAPASLFGRTEPLGMISFILINGALYGIAGFVIESLRWVRRRSA
jgi:hypothetical protein